MFQFQLALATFFHPSGQARARHKATKHTANSKGLEGDDDAEMKGPFC